MPAGRTGVGTGVDLQAGVDLQLTVLGDSIAFGTGAARAADALGPRLATVLRAAGHRTSVSSVAVPGARSADLAAQLRRIRHSPGIALIVIGANDLAHRVPAERAAEQLRAAVRGLRTLGSEVVVAPAPDLSVVPHVPASLREAVRRASELLRRAQCDVVLAEGGRVADLHASTSRAFAADASLFSADRFHPSSRGYAVIAEALAPTVLEAGAAVRTGR